MKPPAPTARRSPGWSTRRWRSCSRAGSRAGASRCATAGRAPTRSMPRTGAAFLRTDPEGLEEAIESLAAGHHDPGLVVSPTWPRPSTRIAALAVDLVVGDWAPDQVAALRDAIAPRALVERTGLPPENEIDDARADLARPLLTAWLGQVHGRRLAPALQLGPGCGTEAPPVPARRLSAEWEDAAWREASPEEGLARLDPDLAGDPRALVAGHPRGWPRSSASSAPAATRSRRSPRWPTRSAPGAAASSGAQLRDHRNHTNQCYFRCGGSRAGPEAQPCAATPAHNVHEVVHRSVEAWGARGHRGLPGGPASTPTSPATSTVGRARGDQGAPARDARARLSAPWRSGRAPTRSDQRARVPGPPARRRALPGTAAEILDDQVRAHLCPDKHRRVGRGDDHRPRRPAGDHHDDHGPHRTAALGQPTSRCCARSSGARGFTEFVPLPFVHMASPIFLQGRSRPGPTWDEVVLVHAVGRIALDGLIDNIQVASWVSSASTAASACSRPAATTSAAP